jgi:hypothetical protein
MSVDAMKKAIGYLRDGYIQAADEVLQEAIAEASEDGLYREGYRNGYAFGEAAGKRQAIAEAEKQEPVAWIHKQTGVITKEWSFDKDLFDPLYTHPQPKQEPLTDEDTVALIKECRDAFAEELSAWDIEPPLHHVQQGHDKCVKWLAAHGIKGEA